MALYEHRMALFLSIQGFQDCINVHINIAYQKLNRS